MLHRWWWLAHWKRLTGGVFKPPLAAAIKSCGSERKRSKALLRCQVCVKEGEQVWTVIWGVERIRWCQNQGPVSILGQAVRLPVYCYCGIRRIDSASLTQAFMWNRRTSRCHAKRKLQAKGRCKKESIDGQHWGGNFRRSVEVLVMSMEQREVVIRSYRFH